MHDEKRPQGTVIVQGAAAAFAQEIIAGPHQFVRSYDRRAAVCSANRFRFVATTMHEWTT